MVPALMVPIFKPTYLLVGPYRKARFLCKQILRWDQRAIDSGDTVVCLVSNSTGMQHILWRLYKYVYVLLPLLLLSLQPTVYCPYIVLPQTKIIDQSPRAILTLDLQQSKSASSPAHTSTRWGLSPSCSFSLLSYLLAMKEKGAAVPPGGSSNASTANTKMSKCVTDVRWHMKTVHLFWPCWSLL